MTDAETPAYIARKTCGCVVMVTIDDPAHRRDTAKEIAACVREGYSVERVSVETAKSLPWSRWYGMCEHDSPEETIRRTARQQRDQKRQAKQDQQQPRLPLEDALPPATTSSV